MMIFSTKTTDKISASKWASILLLFFASSSCVDLSKQQDGSEDAAGTSTEQQEGVDTTANETDEPTPLAINLLGLEGTYEATIPCEDCEGIETLIVLNNNQTFNISSNYLGKNKKIEDNGLIELLEDSTIIQLKGKDTDLKLRAEDDKLFQLDTDNQIIEGENAEHFVYNKK